MKIPTMIAFAAMLTFQVGCKKEPAPPSGGTPAAAKKDSQEHSKDDGHDHGAEGHHEGDGHDHGSAGKARDMGSVKIGSNEVQVVDEGGGVVAGKAGSFHIKIKGGPVKAVRTWVGTESGKESVKSKAEKEGADFHAMPEAPKPLPQGSALWIELETEAGVVKGFIAL